MKPAIVSLFTVTLAACGGDNSSNGKDPSTGGDKPPTVNEAQGIYKGMTDSGRRLIALVLDDGDHAFLYGREGVNEFALSGTILGNASAENGDFASGKATDVSFDDSAKREVSVTANYIVGQYLTGTIEIPEGDPVGFTISYDIDYDGTPDLAASSGTYQGYYKGFVDSVSESALIVVTIAEDGSLTGSREIPTGCVFDGEIVPRATGNLFDVSMSFSSADCALSGQTLSGVAYHDSNNFRLYMAAPTDDKQGGLFFYGFDEKHMP